MSVSIAVQNRSTRKRLYRSDVLSHLAASVCQGEGLREDTELSVLFCDDPFIRELNATYRKKDAPTDVLSFPQDADPDGNRPLLGDIVISLETVERQCDGDRAAMRKELRLLFCHGLLHLLGYEHDTRRARQTMADKQAQYLGLEPHEAWPSEPAVAPDADPAALRGGRVSRGR